MTARPRSSWAALAASVAVVVAAVVGLFTQGTADAFEYSYSLDEGETRAYAMSMAVAFTPQGIPGVTGPLKETVKGRMNMKVLDVADDGSMTVEIKLTDVSVQGPQASTSIADYQNATMKMRVSKTGELLSIEGSSFVGFDPTEFLGAVDGEKKSSAIGSNNLFPVFPSEEIEPGDTWQESGDYPMPFGNQSVHVTIKGKHLGFVDSEYGRTARLNVKSDSPLDLSLAFKDILGAAGGAVPMEEIPPELERVRMVLDGVTHSDMTARVLPEGGDVVQMVMVMNMDVAMRFENFPAELAQGMPSDFRMVGSVTMKLNRVA